MFSGPRVGRYLLLKFKEDFTPEKVNVQLLRAKCQGPGVLPLASDKRGGAPYEQVAQPSPLDPLREGEFLASVFPENSKTECALRDTREPKIPIRCCLELCRLLPDALFT